VRSFFIGLRTSILGVGRDIMLHFSKKLGRCAQDAEDPLSMLTAIEFSTGTSVATVARRRMFVIASESVVGGSPDRNAPIADANQPETINFNGVFRVTTYRGAFQLSEMVCRAKEGRLNQPSPWR